MGAEAVSEKEMGALSRIVGIFTSPRETFESIDRKPTWIIPFLVTVIVFIGFQFLTLDIQVAERLEMLSARNLPAEQMQAAEAQMAGPAKYAGFIVGPIFMLIVWAILAGIFVFAANTVFGGQVKFKKSWSIVAWSSLIGSLGLIIKTLLILQKGSIREVSTSLAMLMPTPAAGETPSILYRLLSKFDLFTIWEIIIWIIGYAVIARFTTKKSATMVISLWVIWIVISVGLGGVLGPMFGQ